ncbi:SGNH/GDSL hydrolase family protein [Paenibacillus nasutitermitis]|uniref:Lipase n=1 Tax=Paenibacillus nasutitermitis TaxID=1652958 RepID=A0A916Z639_9BACL|nr:SGNH/GDSL hydrolase family protein [Paenibacillus nasutitermitis]GGD78388.1 lipase [Paenibacillus nasutitermitis]
MVINDKEIILFQGDSITDCGRNREDGNDLGKGYALMVAGRLQYLYPDKQITCINRGIGGDRVVELQQRWETDCLELKPTLVSIYVGINDAARRYSINDPIPVEQFEQIYRELLTTTKEKLAARIVLVEPFVLPVDGDRVMWREDLDPKIQAVRKLAREFGAAYIPLDGLFAQAAVQAPMEYWAADGVHPSPAGHTLIADAWLKAVVS